MSVFSSNPFAALGDGDDVASAPAPAPKAAPAPAAPAAAKPAQQREQRPAGNRGPRRAPQGDRPINADVPAGEDAKEDRAKNFARGGGRGGRGRSAVPSGVNPRGNSGTYLGGDRPRREKGGSRPFDRQSQTGRVDTDKPAEEGKQELEAEQLGNADAKAETPAEGAATPVREAPIEEEDNTQTYDEYLAAQAEKKLQLSLPEARKANEGEESESLFDKAKAVVKKGEQTVEEWLTGAGKAAPKTKKQKEGKQFLEVDFRSAPRPRRDGERESTRGGRPSRGRGEGRGRGGARNGGAPRAPKAAAPAVPDASAFPALA
ncbi:hypothetical protein JCM8547_001012 [Rhodosporidiobolus lusitaniae]